jgi:hypothetical protein
MILIILMKNIQMFLNNHTKNSVRINVKLIQNKIQKCFYHTQTHQCQRKGNLLKQPKDRDNTNKYPKQIY